MTHEQNLKITFENLKLPPLAIAWLCDMWASIQLFDDVADKDEIKREDLDRVIWALFIGMNRNMFWVQNSLQLMPIIEMQILKWQASDKAELGGRANEQSYMWRAGYYDLVLMVYYLCHGENMARVQSENILKQYGETFEEYKKEFNNA